MNLQKIIRSGLLLAFFAVSGVANAIPALTFPSVGFENSAGTTSTRGYAFDVLSAVTVTHLSFYDSPFNGVGLADSHEVGLWDPSGVLLSSGTIASGVVAPLDSTGLFRLLDVADFVLGIGTGYTVGALFIAGSADRQASQLPSVSTPAEISYVERRFINNGIASLTRPTSTDGILGLPGGSFEIAAAVPEPTTLSLFGLSLAGLGWFRRKKV